MAKAKETGKAADVQVAVEQAPDAEALAAVTTESATTAEDVALLAYKGESMPSGWAYNPRRGFYKTDVAVDPMRPIDPVYPNATGADAPNTPESEDGV